MNILHYLNVLIGFSLVMLLLSVVTSFAAQTWLLLLKTQSRAVGNGLVGMLEDIGLEKALATQQVDALLNKGSSIFGRKLGGVLNKVSAFLLAGAPKHIGREEFVLLLLRKAVSDNELATKLGFADKTAAKSKLQELEEAILVEETTDPTLPAHLWRTKAMQAKVPELASKIFARFDDVLDRATEDVSAFGKFLGILLTLPLLLIYWPVDSIDLFDRLNKDQILSAKLATATEANLPSLQQAYDEFQKCRDGKTSPDVKDPCEQSGQALKKAANDIMQLGEVKGLFGENTPKELDCKILIVDRPIPLFEHCKRAELTSGIFVTWILVSLGSAFWLGLLNKMLGLRSELSKKLEAQREFRATSQA
ncbi:MAG: hypothetical protein E8D48_12680 [Nitrospira sp.]|nr:MAG: hypothetical protein E8D48_12680 [Nitrospira sp.]